MKKGRTIESLIVESVPMGLDLPK